MPGDTDGLSMRDRVATLPPDEKIDALRRRAFLFGLLVRRDIESQFRGSVLGLAWVVLIPASLVLIYTFVFGVVLKMNWTRPTGNPLDVPLIYFFGISLFAFFMEIILRGPRCLHENAAYVTKVVFPLEMLVWVLVSTALVKLAINLVLLWLLSVLFGSGMPLAAMLLIVWIAPLVLISAGIAYGMAAIGAYVKDLSHVLQAVGPILVFMSPVFYSLSQVPAAYRPVYLANPLTLPLDNGRGLLFSGQPHEWATWPAYVLAALAVLWLGRRFFARMRPGFADVV
jgi:lipopolysaccharide transport system permease protein